MFNIPPYSFHTMIFILGLMSIASTTRLLLRWWKPHQENTELRLRIQSWWWMIGILFAVLTIGNRTTIIFFGLLSFLALKEFISIVPTRQSDRRAIFWAYLLIPLQYYWVSIGWHGMFLIFIPVYMFLFLPMRMVLVGETKGFIRSAGVLHWSVMLTVFCLSHIAYLLTLPVLNPKAGNIGLILFLIFMTQFNDVNQYIFGKLFGKCKIIPKVSPNKTWAGLLGGLIIVTLSSGLIAPILTPLSSLHGLLVGAIIALGGFIGDIVISSVKRDMQIKDTGRLIPGHGGILDRLDSLTFTAPLFFHFIYYVYY